LIVRSDAEINRPAPILSFQQTLQPSESLPDKGEGERRGGRKEEGEEGRMGRRGEGGREE
jgi:hypothetical protein